MKMLNEDGARVLGNGASQALSNENSRVSAENDTSKNGAYLGALPSKPQDEKFILEYGESLAEGDLRPILLKNYDGAYKAPQQNPAYYNLGEKPCWES